MRKTKKKRGKYRKTVKNKYEKMKNEKRLEKVKKQ